MNPNRKEKIIIYNNQHQERWQSLISRFAKIAKANAYTRSELLTMLIDNIENGKIKI